MAKTITQELRALYQLLHQMKLIISWVLVDEDPTPAGFMNDYITGKPARIFKGLSEGSIWGAVENNWTFRIIHDSFHALYNLPFTLAAEIEVASKILKVCLDNGLERIGWVQYLDTVLPAIYNEINGHFSSQELIKGYIIEFGEAIGINAEYLQNEKEKPYCCISPKFTMLGCGSCGHPYSTKIKGGEKNE